MLFVVKKEKINNHKNLINGIMHKCHSEVIEKNEVIISHNGKIVAQIPTSALSDDTPVNVHNILNNPLIIY